MSIVTTSGQVVNAHYNDRFFEAQCPECNEEVWGETLTELAEVLDCHC